jgi:ubiquinone/menaquinone biosynthesis C-methylase UbiE
MTSVVDAVEADRVVKAKHRAMWATGDYPELAADLIWSLGSVVADAAAITAGDRVLDVAAGSGNVALRAAQRGAEVVASDLTPELFADGRRRAAELGVGVRWAFGDAERLPYGDEDFDVVTSCVGVMFAPHHRAAAEELVRVCRRGGRIAVLSWTPSGFIGQMFAAMKPFVPPPPPGAQPPPLWGDEDHVRELFGERVSGLSLERRTVTIDQFATPEEFREYFKSHYGPTISAYAYNASKPENVAGLDAALDDLARRANRGTGSLVLDWEYLLVTGRRAG